MKAKETSLFNFLDGTKQFVIPIYQRTYSWTIAQCEQLWNDIERLANNPAIPGHFIGSVVYVEGSMYSSTVVPQLLVIDGQQRLSTLSLLIAALGKAIEERVHETVSITRRKLRNYYLRNDDEDGDLAYKLLLTQSDKPSLMAVVDDKPLSDDSSQRIRENYAYFVEQLRQAPNLQPIFSGLQRLIIVDISLERGKDNPQLIFESLNSTGLKLTQADLIRNYILMGQQPEVQTQLYQQHWFPMEQRFGHAEYAGRFNRFMRDYLTIKLGYIPNIDDVYDEFKRLINSNQLSIQQVIAEIDEYSQYFVQLSFERSDDPALVAAIHDIHTLKVDVAFPFLMECLRFYARHHINRNELLTLFRMVESYVFRRAICGISTNSLNKIFAMLMRDMSNESLLARYELTAQSSLIEQLAAVFVDKDASRRFPTDEEFQRELLSKDINNFRNRNYLLYRLEAGVGGIPRQDGATLNIIPRNSPLSAEWQAELGEDWANIQIRYLDRLSNLTLVSQGLIDDEASFGQKRDHADGFAANPSPLNNDLRHMDGWDEHLIEARAENLAKLACEVWPYPNQVQVIQRNLKDRRSANETALQSEYLLGEVGDLYREFRRRVLNLDTAIREEPLRLYIAFKLDTNIVDVVPQRRGLRLSLNMPFAEINDPLGLCKDVSNVGRWGNGDVEVLLLKMSELDQIIDLVRQALDYHRDA
ncbi:DUF262 domain-containing protein [Herpetosiphon sp. NSE202]|uniref:GmrSD restriction endonuclease domain-containing protein n=1 Tax=Herpetosiphon sp. NSE202 TaxID=3351349 RepID=UPI003638C790